MTVRLHVNIDHVATLRRLRDTRYPDLGEAAHRCLQAGAHGITMHLREDRRHVTDGDVRRVRALVRTQGAVFNLEMAVTEEMVNAALELRPDLVTLVPERRLERTTEGGLDVASKKEEVVRACRRLEEKGIGVSLFIGPDAPQVEASSLAGAQRIELHTGRYCGAADRFARDEELERLRSAALLAHQRGLLVAAGHGLYYDDVQRIAAIPEVCELNIGHGIICRAVEVGLGVAVSEMLAAIGRR